MQRTMISVAVLLIAFLLSACAQASAGTAVPTVRVGAAPPGATGSEGSSIPEPTRPDVLLATTTSVQDSGLLDVLLPDFRQQTGYVVKPIAVGSGQALALARRGEADVLLSHAPAAERQFMEAEYGLDRREVMRNTFLLLGPPADPAGVRATDDAAAAFRQIFEHATLFVSRGDDSGTHQLELAIWQQAGLAPAGQPWYQQAGQGMGATLTIASEKQAYTVADRGTYLARRRSLAIAPLLERGEALLNVYSVIRVSPTRHPLVNVDGATAFADYLVSPRTQEMIGRFGIDRYGEPLFTPSARSGGGETAKR